METKFIVLSPEELDNIIQKSIKKAVTEILNNKEEAPEVLKPFLNTDECAEYIGVAKSTLYKLTSDLLIPHYKHSKRIYFKRSEVDAWIMRNRVKSMDEIEQEATDYITRNPTKW